MEALKTCRGLLEKGCSLLFFPEGTRTADGKMHDFKKGAFSVAAKMKVLLRPHLPSLHWLTLYSTSQAG
jgi:1-acyl-sn-glycerol-3-phosphate acyltransferase